MTKAKKSQLTRVGIFYDGNYFWHVSTFYYLHHERKSRLSVGGLHRFLRYQIAQMESTQPELCKIVDAHYFRGRLSASEAAKATGDVLHSTTCPYLVLVRERRRRREWMSSLL